MMAVDCEERAIKSALERQRSWQWARHLTALGLQKETFHCSFTGVSQPGLAVRLAAA